MGIWRKSVETKRNSPKASEKNSVAGLERKRGKQPWWEKSEKQGSWEDILIYYVGPVGC